MPNTTLSEVKLENNELASFTCMSVSHDEPFLAAGSKDGVVSVWNYMSGVREEQYKDEDTALLDIAMSHTGVKVATGGMSGIGFIRDMADPASRVVRLVGHQEAINGIYWSPNDMLIATSDVAGSVRLWDPHSGVCLHVLEAHKAAIQGVVFSLDSTRIATSGGWVKDLEEYDKAVHVWDTSSGKLVATLAGHGHLISALAFDHARVATGCDDGKCRVWSAETGEELHAIDGTGSPIGCVTFSPDGRDIVAGFDDGTVVVWDSRSGEQRQSLVLSLFEVASVVYSHSGRLIAAGYTYGRVAVWDTVTEDTLATIDDNEDHDIVKSVAFAPDDQYLIVNTHSGSVRVWRLREVMGSMSK